MLREARKRFGSLLPLKYSYARNTHTNSPHNHTETELLIQGLSDLAVHVIRIVVYYTTHCCLVYYVHLMSYMFNGYTC